MWPFRRKLPLESSASEPLPTVNKTFRLVIKNDAETVLRGIVEIWGEEFSLSPDSEAEIVAMSYDDAQPWINLVYRPDYLSIYVESADDYRLTSR